MKLSDGIEQAIHCMTMLASLEEGSTLSAAALAEFHGVSPSYLLKHLQALSAGGLVATVPGPKGGYRLGRTAAAITLLDIVIAVEGPQPAFRCNEIRQRGPNPLPARYFDKPCGIAAAMLAAERAYRAELKKTSIADLIADLTEADDGGIAARGCAFLEINERKAAR
ncbi:Rrf2 family transcriptional regulator [Rhizobium sp. CECT 9324]|uniref:RrF2 family transcriptional regulator n=1 Tax=Rhizobium sp. CECT 9324 TaxID=2845820 RepID=UPI000DDD3347|nr:Rrf2 family transcriptional regulator [Rhizobium sp. CECT 9324]CAH0339390.1 Putative HTH-type transcriptional regulator [Rhizobium sp. CECT 9324]